MELNQRLRILRTLRGLSQPQLAAEAGTSQAQIANYERGNYRPKSKALLQMAKALNVTPDFLEYGSPPITSQYWRIEADTRDRITAKIAKDIIELLPLLFREAKFCKGVTASMSDGFVIFLGRYGEQLDTMLIVSNPILSDAVFHAITVSEVDVTKRSFRTSLQNMFLIMDEIDNLSVDTITRSWERAKSAVVFLPLTIPQNTLKVAYDVARSCSLKPEDFLKLCIKISNWPAASATADKIREHVQSQLSK